VAVGVGGDLGGDRGGGRVAQGERQQLGGGVEGGGRDQMRVDAALVVAVEAAGAEDP